MHYFFHGLRLLTQKGLKRFVLIPLLINIVLFFAALIWLWQVLRSLIDTLQSSLPEWLHWLEFLLIPLGLFSLIVSFAYSFTMVANIIAAPFNGLLSEKTEQLLNARQVALTGQAPALNLPDITLKQFMADCPRMLGREWQKLCYLLPRAIVLFVLCWFIPIIGVVLWFLCSAWFYSLQYIDYPFDNHRISFLQLRAQVRRSPKLSLSFGSAIAVGSMIPVFNLLVMPAAVCGATAMWHERFAAEYDPALHAAGARSYKKLDKYC